MKSIYIGLFLFLSLSIFYLSIQANIIEGTGDSFPDQVIPELGGPGPIFSFGHNIQPKGTLILKKGFYYFSSDAPFHSTWLLSYATLYGFTQRFTGLIDLTIVLNQDIVPPFRSKGIGSLIFQGEYALYNYFDENSRHQFTLVGAIYTPSLSKQVPFAVTTPTTGYFAGFTSYNLTPIWYTYSCLGTIRFKKKGPVSLGSYIFSSMGIGRTVAKTPRTYFALVADSSVIYARPGFINKKRNLNSGFTFVGLGPTFRFSFNDLVVLGGLQYPIGQVVRNPIDLIQYRAGISFSWIF